MIVRRLFAVFVLLAASLGLVAVPAYAEDCQPASSPEARGKIPVCDTPNGRTFELSVSRAAAGGTIDFEGTGFVSDLGGGQTLTFKFNDIGYIGTPVRANDDGTVTGTLQLPDAGTFERYRSEYGSERWWIRVLVGGAVPNDGPNSSLHDGFDLIVPPTVTGGSVNAQGTKLALQLKPGSGEKTKLVVKSKGKVALKKGGKKKVITAASGSAVATDEVTLPLTKAGKKYFKTNGALTVVVTSKVRGAGTAATTFKIKKRTP